MVVILEVGRVDRRNCKQTFFKGRPYTLVLFPPEKADVKLFLQKSGL